MKITEQLAKHFRDIHFGGNWTCSNLRDQIKDIPFEKINLQVNGFNSVLTLTCHTTYYDKVLRQVLEGGELNSKDELSFVLPTLHSQADWEAYQEQLWQQAEATARLIEQMPDEKLSDYFTEEKYGTYYRNIAGIIEHLHYHLGQIALIKKMI